MFAAELTRFLSSAEPEVLCVTGRWGVGKTFTWNHYLKLAQDAKIVALDKYAYVSLFGRNSLDDVRTAIVENTVDSRIVGKTPDLASFTSLFAQAESNAKLITKFARFFPGAAQYVESAHRALFLTVRNQIICIDDLERAGPGLDTRNILGLISSLKEERTCKVKILFNQEELSGPSNQKDFSAQLEKVADTIMTFEPTPTELTDIAVDKSAPFAAWLVKNTQTLGIVNIRFIKKIETFCRRITEI